MKKIDNYITVMFPYPSGDGLHVGHYYNYAIIDSYCRYKRYIGESVFQPFGYDSFGLPAENYAKKIGGDVSEITYKNIERFRAQMIQMNTEYEELLITSDPDYIKWTQKIFTLLKDNNLAYKAMGIQEYCESCETVIAREQVIDNKCERCGSIVIKKELEQWYLRITDYKERLIKNLAIIDYPKKTINAQRNWLENQHDWCVSRQRKWGTPIPIDGENDTLDTFVDSSFYYIIYCVKKGIKPRPIDIYVGGSEHACMHLIYARFICMFLYDIGIVDFEEPFNKVIHQGMITYNGNKMSKSRGNVINPDDYDPDVLRFYLMFIGHYFDGGEWNDNNIKGVVKFINRMKVWLEEIGDDEIDIADFREKIFNYTESFKFNKVVSEFMILYKKNKNKRLSENQVIEIKNLLKIFIPGFK